VLCIFNTEAIAAAEPLALLFKKVKDSVVVIHTVERGWQADSKKIISAQGIGSGVVVSQDGLIMTAAHVVQVADALEVHFRDGSISKASIVSSSPRTDLALLKLDGHVSPKIKVAKLGNSQNLQIGDGLFAIGAPHGVAYTLTTGHVSNVLSTGILALQNSEVEVILTDTGIDVGNSGGPVFNMHGEVVGIVSQFFPFEESSGAIGVAVSINSAQEILLQDKPFWSGMEVFLLPKHLAKVFNLPPGENGFLVQRIAKRSPAEKSGLKAGTIRAKIGGVNFTLGGDIITRVNDIKVSGDKENNSDLMACLCENKTVELTVLRNGEQKKIKLTPLHQSKP